MKRWIFLTIAGWVVLILGWIACLATASASPDDKGALSSGVVLAMLLYGEIREWLVKISIEEPESSK